MFRFSVTSLRISFRCFFSVLPKYPPLEKWWLLERHSPEWVPLCTLTMYMSLHWTVVFRKVDVIGIIIRWMITLDTYCFEAPSLLWCPSLSPLIIMYVSLFRDFHCSQKSISYLDRCMSFPRSFFRKKKEFSILFFGNLDPFWWSSSFFPLCRTPFVSFFFSEKIVEGW